MALGLEVGEGLVVLDLELTQVGDFSVQGADLVLPGLELRAETVKVVLQGVVLLLQQG